MPTSLRLIRQLVREGWTVTRTHGGHWKAVHPRASGPLYLSGSPSDHRAERNARALARRLLR